MRGYFCMAKSWRSGTHRDGVEHVVTEWNIQWLSATAPDSKRFQLLLSSVTRELHSYEYWWERIFVWLSRDGVEHTVTEWNTLWRSGIYSDWVQLHQTASVSSSCSTVCVFVVQYSCLPSNVVPSAGSEPPSSATWCLISSIVRHQAALASSHWT